MSVANVRPSLWELTSLPSKSWNNFISVFEYLNWTNLCLYAKSSNFQVHAGVIITWVAFYYLFVLMFGSADGTPVAKSGKDRAGVSRRSSTPAAAAAAEPAPASAPAEEEEPAAASGKSVRSRSNKRR
jgi:hypothetical protein